MRATRRFCQSIVLGGVAFAVALSGSALADDTTVQPVMVNRADLCFSPTPGAPDCTTAATLRGDPGKGPSTQLQNLNADCRVPWHWHAPSENVTVISGTFHLETKDAKTPLLRAGGYACMPSHHVHQGSSSDGCLLSVSTDDAFDIPYVDDAGKEVSLDEALKLSRASAHPKRASKQSK